MTASPVEEDPMPAEDPSRTLVLRRHGGGPLAVSTALAVGLAVLGAVRGPQTLWLTFLMTAVSALAVGVWLRMRIEVRPDGLAFRGLRATRLVPWSAVVAAYRSGKDIAVVHSDDRVAVLPGRLRPSSGTLTTEEILDLLQRRIAEHGPDPEEDLEPEGPVAPMRRRGPDERDEDGADGDGGGDGSGE